MARIGRVGTSGSEGGRRRGRSKAATALLVVALAGAGATVASSRADAVAFNVVVTLRPKAIQAATTQTTTATATVTYQGAGQPNQWVRFTSSGDATPLQSQCFTAGLNGTCSVQIRAGSAYGPQTITATIVDGNGNPNGAITGSNTASLFQYYPPTAVAVAFAGNVNRVAPNGTATTTAVATLTDAQGRRVPSQAVGFATDATTSPVAFGPLTDKGDGTYTTLITGPAVVAPATQRITQTITATASAWSVSGSAPLTVGNPSFHTSGNAIYDDFNRRVNLQGADLYGGWYVAPLSPYPDTAAHMATASMGSGTPGVSWGFNMARIELSDAFWFSTVPYSATDQRPCGTVYQQTVADVVNQVTSRGMVALLDLHAVPAASTQTDVPPSALECTSAVSGAGHPSLRAMADAAYAPSFWSQVAAAYKDNPMVAFELYNEPFMVHDIQNVAGMTCIPGTIPAGSSPAGTWHDGGQVFSGNGPYTATGMQALYNNVRATGATNLTLVGGVGPAQCNEAASYDIRVARTNPIVDGTGAPAPNVVYSSHPYWGPNCGTPGGSTGIPTDLDTVVAPTAAIYPVVFSEFGSTCDAVGGAQYYTQAIINYAVSHQLGWSIYPFLPNWGPNVWGIYQCDPDYTPRCQTLGKTYAFYEPRDRGIPAYNQLQATPNRLN